MPSTRRFILSILLSATVLLFVAIRQQDRSDVGLETESASFNPR